MTAIFNSSTTSCVSLSGAIAFQLAIDVAETAYLVTLRTNGDDYGICVCEVEDDRWMPIALQEADRIRKEIFDAIVAGKQTIMTHDRYYSEKDGWVEIEYEFQHQEHQSRFSMIYPVEESISADILEKQEDN